MRAMALWGVVLAILSTGCGTGTTAFITAPTPAVAGVHGTWTGSLSDSSGSMMGAGMSATMMTNATWSFSGYGTGFTAFAAFPGYFGAPITMFGSVNGQAGTFTIVVPNGSTVGLNCVSTASGTFDLDDSTGALHGMYSGTNTCTGPFTDGHMTLVRQ